MSLNSAIFLSRILTNPILAMGAKDRYDLNSTSKIVVSKIRGVVHEVWAAPTGKCRLITSEDGHAGIGSWPTENVRRAGYAALNSRGKRARAEYAGSVGSDRGARRRDAGSQARLRRGVRHPARPRQIRMEAEDLPFAAGTTVIVPPGIVHQVINTGEEELDFLAVLGMAPVRLQTADGRPVHRPWLSP